MGKPRQPISLILAKGNKAHLTKAEIEERTKQEVKAKDNNIQPPSYLPDNLKKEFNIIAEELKELGIMSNLDCSALARYVSSEYQYQKVLRSSFKMSPENEKYPGLLLMQEKLFKMARQAATDLGLTISSRCKLVLPKKEKERELTEEERLFGGSL